MKAKLFVIPGSHPCAAVEAALGIKQISYQRVDLLPLSQVVIGPLRFGGTTVPGLRIDGERLVGSRAIMRRLEELVPDPALYPSGSPEVLAAERWGDEVLQDFARRLVDALLLRRPAVMLRFIRDARLPLPKLLLRPALPLTARLMAAKNHASELSAREDLAVLPDHLDRVDRWIADGALGLESPNGADLQIGSSLRLMSAFGDLRPLIDGRPARRLIDLFPPLGIDVAPGILRPG